MGSRAYLYKKEPFCALTLYPRSMLTYSTGRPIVGSGSGDEPEGCSEVMKRLKRVALMFPIARTQQAQRLRGVTDYAAKCGNWTLDRNPGPSAASLRTLAGWSGDGVLASLGTVAELRTAKTLDVPVVNISAVLHHVDFPRVMVDQQAVGRLAADHLLERGFRRTGYFGQRGMWYSQQREVGFVERIMEGGGVCSVLDAPATSAHPSLASLDGIARRVAQDIGMSRGRDGRPRQPGPHGARRLFAPRAPRASGRGADRLRERRSRVPVRPRALEQRGRNSWREGYEAAALLDRLMAGRRPPKPTSDPAGGRGRASLDGHGGHRESARRRRRAVHSPAPR